MWEKTTVKIKYLKAANLVFAAFFYYFFVIMLNSQEFILVCHFIFVTLGAEIKRIKNAF